MILREKDKKRIIEIAQKTLNASTILAFGSRVNGTGHDTSDLDLVIRSNSNEKLDINELTSFKEQLRDSNIPIIIQTLDWYRIPQSFHDNILENYEELVSIGSV
jgi:predicted nucleotidyltransferase